MMPAIDWSPTGTVRLLPEGQALCFRSYLAGWRAAERGVSLAGAERRATRSGKFRRHRGEYMHGWRAFHCASMEGAR